MFCLLIVVVVVLGWFFVCLFVCFEHDVPTCTWSYLGLLQILIFKSSNTHVNFENNFKISKILKRILIILKNTTTNAQFINPKYGYFDEGHAFRCFMSLWTMWMWSVILVKQHFVFCMIFFNFWLNVTWFAVCQLIFSTWV